jgi:ADP-ribosylglycohydrolase
MRFLAILLYFFPVPAFAHWGHLPELAGHSHWIGMAAAAAAAAAAAWGLRENSEDSSNDDEAYEEIEEELQET